MGIIQDFIQKMKDKKELREGYSRERYVEEEFAQRKLTSNERELRRFQEEDRQKRIKELLKQRRAQEDRKIWSGQHHNPAFAPNVVAGQKNLFSGKNMFGEMPNIVNQPNITKCKNIFECKHGGKKK